MRDKIYYLIFQIIAQALATLRWYSNSKFAFKYSSCRKSLTSHDLTHGSREAMGQSGHSRPPFSYGQVGKMVENKKKTAENKQKARNKIFSGNSALVTENAFSFRGSLLIPSPTSGVWTRQCFPHKSQEAGRWDWRARGPENFVHDLLVHDTHRIRGV